MNFSVKRRWTARYILRLLALAFLALGVVACERKLDPETACNFVQNSAQQRVSWGSEILKFYVHESVPIEYYIAIRKAADSWNDVVGREAIRIEIEGVSGDVSARKDGTSTIYLLEDWDNDNLREQARTSVRWRGSQIIEADILLNEQYFNFSVNPDVESGKVDLESLVLHEMGHALGLGHVEGELSVMNPQLARGDDRRDVTRTDIDSLSCEY